MTGITLPLNRMPSRVQTVGQALRHDALLCLFALFVLFAVCLSSTPGSGSLTAWTKRKNLAWEAWTGALPTTYTGEEHYPDNLLNATLGFGKIIVLNLAHRHDKRDELSLMAKVTGLELQYYHPRLPSELRHEGLPPHIGNKKGLNPPNESAFRGHADLWREIALGEEETVLILEDDIDWDVRLRDSLKAFSAPLAQFSASETGKTTSIAEDRPWQHQAWDIFYLGACVENTLWHDNAKKFVNTSRLPFLRYADERAPDIGQWSHDFTQILPKYNVSQPGKGVVHDQQSRQRVIARAVAPACSAAYALTRAGAARLLFHVTRQYDGDTDVAIAKALVDDYLKGYIMMPSLMGQWHAYHSNSNSDLHFSATGGSLAEQLQRPNLFDPSKGHNRDVRNSTRDNLRSLVKALTT